MSEQQLCLKWNNYNRNFQAAFTSLLEKENLVDVILTCEGRKLKCHRIVLSAASPYFEDLFSDSDDLQSKNSIVFMKGVKFLDLQAIVQFIYCGEVNVHQVQLESLLKVADELKVRGLADEKPQNLEEQSDKSTSIQPKKRRRHSGASVNEEKPQIQTPETVNTSTVETPVTLTDHNHQHNELKYSDKEENGNLSRGGSSSPTQQSVVVQPTSSSVSITVKETESPADLEPPDNNNSHSLHIPHLMQMEHTTSSDDQAGEVDSPGQKFPCPNQCGRQYVKHSNLTRHIKLECNQEKQFICLVCQEKFRHKHSLGLHIRRKHSGPFT